MIVLERSYLPGCTIGRLHLPRGLTIFTLERPWRRNEPFVSCIPEGRYSLERDDGGRHQWFRIPDEEVAPRSAIEVHPANHAHELNGCIAPGMELATQWWGVRRSKAACERMVELLGERELLWIRSYRPEGLEGDPC